MTCLDADAYKHVCRTKKHVVMQSTFVLMLIRRFAKNAMAAFTNGRFIHAHDLSGVKMHWNTVLAQSRMFFYVLA